MKIAHEHPLEISNLINSCTDYNYYISSIAAHNPSYFEHAKQDTRFKILDCGTFEEGKPMSDKEYITYIEAIEPNEFVVPDHLFDKDKTIESASRWLYLIRELSIKGLPIAVVQGKTLQEQVDCYVTLTSMYDKVAIPYDLPSTTTNGRLTLITHLFKEDIFRKDKKHHFLGIDNTLEFTDYKSKELEAYDILRHIDSIDTSSPILHGLKNIAYSEEYGLLKKDKQMMKDFILLEGIDNVQRDLILRNLFIFRDFVAPKILKTSISPQDLMLEFDDY